MNNLHKKLNLRLRFFLPQIKLKNQPPPQKSSLNCKIHYARTVYSASFLEVLSKSK